MFLFQYFTARVHFPDAKAPRHCNRNNPAARWMEESVCFFIHDAELYVTQIVHHRSRNSRLGIALWSRNIPTPDGCKGNIKRLDYSCRPSRIGLSHPVDQLSLLEWLLGCELPLAVWWFPLMFSRICDTGFLYAMGDMNETKHSFTSVTR